MRRMIMTILGAVLLVGALATTAMAAERGPVWPEFSAYSMRTTR